jgi:hypothetical protein
VAWDLKYQVPGNRYLSQVTIHARHSAPVRDVDDNPGLPLTRHYLFVPAQVG